LTFFLYRKDFDALRKKPFKKNEMKKKVLFLLLSSVFIGYAQQDSLSIYEVEYSRTLSPNSLKIFTSSYFLQKIPDLSISIFDTKNKSNQISGLVNDEEDDTVFYYTPNGENISLVYKDYSNNKLFSKGEIVFKYFTIEDSLNIFDWKIIEETKKI